MVKNVDKLLDRLIDHELRTAQALFGLLVVGFTCFTFYGDNLPVKGTISHQWLNGIDALVAFVIFIGLLFIKPVQVRYQQCAYVFMYTMNLVNIYLLYGTSFHVQYAYQFIVAYTISGWFFRDKRNWLIHTLVINILLVIVIVFTKKENNSTFDFYATHIIAVVAQAVLIHFRFSIEDKLRNSEKMYRLLAENSFDLICIHNTDGSLQFVSPSAERLLGYSTHEMLGRKPYEIVHPDDKELIQKLNFHDPGNATLQQPIQYRLQHANGSYVWIETIFTTITENEGTNNAVLSQSRDIRRSKNAQFQLQERTKELERSNADLEMFAFVSSHDMQEPLRMISNYMQLLKKRYDGKLDEQAQEYIDYANKGASNLQQLLRDLLSYSRITRTEIKRELVDLNDVMKDVLKNIEVPVMEKSAEVVFNHLPQINTDRNLIMLVLQNLVLNGVKYNRANIPQVTVTSENSAGRVLLTIADNGIGIKAEHQQRIFEPFYRLHTKAEFSGTGLGLSICKKIVERQGGNISVSSAEGKGSIFTVSLPI